MYQKAPGLPAQERERYLYGMDMIGVMQMDASAQQPGNGEEQCEGCPPPPPPLSVGLSCNGQRMYYLKDQVGNVRVILLRGTTAGTPPLAFQNYYPFGMKQPGGLSSSHTQRFGYQGEYAEQDPETKLAAFEARMNDAVTGRWLAVDPQHQYHSPYLAMGNNPVMMVDPDGEFAFLVPGLVGGLINLAIAGMRGEIQSFKDFTHTFAKGFLMGSVSAMAASGLGLVAAGGLQSLGVGVKAANFIGGFAGNFAAGSLINGGVPKDLASFGTLAATSTLAGMSYNGLPKNVSSLSDADELAQLRQSGLTDASFITPTVRIEDLQSGNYPLWWGETNWFLYKANILGLYYNGIADNVSRFFNGNPRYTIWKDAGDGRYLQLPDPSQPKVIAGEFPNFLGGGGIGNIGKGYKYAKTIGGKYHQYTKVVKANKLPGQARAEWHKIFNNKGQLIKKYDDVYRIDGRWLKRSIKKPGFPGTNKYSY